jgi:hypothetical protein
MPAFVQFLWTSPSVLGNEVAIFRSIRSREPKCCVICVIRLRKAYGATGSADI